MFQLFKSAPVVSDEEQQWLVDTFIWAFDQFDGMYFFKHTHIVSPDGKDFPDKVSSLEAMAHSIFEKVLSYSGTSQWPFQLSTSPLGGQMTVSKLIFKNGFRGTQVSVENSGAVLPVLINPSQLNQPQDLIADLAIQVAHHMILQRGSLPPGGQEQLKAASEILAVFLGFGVMVSNTIYHFRGGCGSCYNPYANRQSHLTEAQSLFVLALVHYFKPEHDVKKHLKPYLKSEYKKAQKQVKNMIKDASQGELMALEEVKLAQLS